MASKKHLRLLAKSKGVCALCGLKLGKDVDYDHITPSGIGGGDEEYNLQACHPHCNRNKGKGRNIRPRQATSGQTATQFRERYAADADFAGRVDRSRQHASRQRSQAALVTALAMTAHGEKRY